MINPFKKSPQPLVEFYSLIPGLASIIEVQPKPSNRFQPAWWKDIPGTYMHKDSVRPEIPTVKNCPSFPDFFAQGFTIPMWADTTFYHDPKTEEWKWTCGNESRSPFSISVHPNPQLLDHTDVRMNNKKVSLVFKLICPWRLKTPKGYSVLQLPMFYEFNRDISLLPGIVHTDIHHELNQQVFYSGDAKEVFIKRGTPLVQYIPFKRQEYGLDVRDANSEDNKIVIAHEIDIVSKYMGAYKRRRQSAFNNVPYFDGLPD